MVNDVRDNKFVNHCMYCIIQMLVHACSNSMLLVHCAHLIYQSSIHCTYVRSYVCM